MNETCIYGAIDRYGCEYYTDMRKVFSAIKDRQIEYNWLITDCECFPCDSNIDDLLNQEYCWISGEQLTEIINKEKFQWVWGVLSGFKKDISLEDVLKAELPYANGYTGFWKNPLSMQHPLADIEIVPWDGSLTLILSNNPEIISDFMSACPNSQLLDDYNRE